MTTAPAAHAAPHEPPLSDMPRPRLAGDTADSGAALCGRS
ncbi:hypothetical protein TUE45_pSRTUE45c_0101 (plasmid) [Streptomyces reticuli]|nr:hypothetical protein TUE45_pSRTUE45c_0101 [Streptomyces reticuli]